MSRVRFLWGSPLCLYRAFDREEFARAFIDSGCFRMMHIRHYAVTEDKTRSDSEEGMWSWAGPDGSGGRYCSSYAAYICCLSGPDIDLRHLSKFGRYLVRINDPVQFANDIDGYIKLPVKIECVRVNYRNIAVLERRPSTEDAYRSTYTEKPVRFSRECELRVAVVSSTIGKEYLGYHIDLKRELTYAELLQ